MNFVRKSALRSSEMLQIKGEFEGYNLNRPIMNKKAKMKTEVLSGKVEIITVGYWEL